MLRLNKSPPKRVVVESDDGNLVAIGLGKKAMLVASSSEAFEEGERVVARAGLRRLTLKAD